MVGAKPQSKRYLAIVLYRCLIDNEPTGTIDFQVRYYEGQNKEAVKNRILRERMTYHQTSGSQTTKWVLDEIAAIEEFDDFDDAQEVIGFVRSFGGRRDSQN